MREILSYIASIFTGKRKDTKTGEIKAMHWINRISILIFIVAMIVLIYRRF